MRLDLLTAIRQLRRAPATTLAAIVTLAVGIGATTAVFSFVAAVLSAGAPVDDMDRLVALWSHNRSETETKGLVSAGDYRSWQARATSFESMQAMESRSFNVSGIGTAVRAGGAAVTEGYLELFRWRPFLGRSFAPDDFLPGAPRVAMATHQFWTVTLGENRNVVGQTIRLDGEPSTVIGVLPRMPASSGIYVPAQLDSRREDRSTRTLFVLARLRPGVSLEQARAEMIAIGESLEREHPQTNRGWAINTRPLQEEFVGPQARLAFGFLAGTVLTVLLIGCVNIANLLLARGVARQGELAVRLALGAGGWRVVRQLMVECALLAALGALLSLAVSRWTMDVLITLGPLDSPWVANTLNVRVLILTAVISVFATIAAGLAPALAARRANLMSGLHQAGRAGGSGTRRTTRLLVASQVALAVMLLIVASLAMRTLIAIERLEPGFQMDNVLTASVTLPEAIAPQAAARWFDNVLSRTRQLPGVVSAGATSRLPFAGGRWNPNRGLEIEGQPPTDATAGRWAVDYVITPGLIETLRVRVVSGRVFGDQDGRGAPLVAIVNEAMARRFWPNGSPLGARVRQADDPAGQWRTVVGIVADIRNDDADQPPLPYLYTPLAQRPMHTMTLALRSAGDPAAMADSLRRAVAAIDADQALYDVRTMRAVWENDLQGSRILIQVMAALALIALGLAGVGVWGVAAQSVGQRTREIGVRIALGASAGAVARLIAWQGVMPLAAGLVVGVVGGLALGRLMRAILFQVSPTDPVTLVLTLAVLAAVGIIATVGPALRAARLDPLTALRTE